jgi:hypothetical protein
MSEVQRPDQKGAQLSIFFPCFFLLPPLRPLPAAASSNVLISSFDWSIGLSDWYFRIRDNAAVQF